MDVRAVGKGSNTLLDAIRIDVHEQINAQFLGHPIAKSGHFLEFPAGIDMEERERGLGRVERFHRKMKHHGGILADRIEHDRIGEGGCDFTKNVNRLSFETLKMGQRHDWAFSPHIWFGERLDTLAGEGNRFDRMGREICGIRSNNV
jgi:hypothetical protein